MIVFLILLLSGCKVGPNYTRPCVLTPVKFKEAPKGWKFSKPRDECDRGKWWQIFHDPELNRLEARLNISNQNILNAAANYRQALALVDEARAAYFPTLTGSANVQRQKSVIGAGGGSATSSTINSTTGTTTTITGTTPGATFTNTHGWLLNGSWEPDLWGSVARSVEASQAGAQSSAALLALTRLSAQASLAQFYFELRYADIDQSILDRIVSNNKKILKLTQNEYRAGTVSRSDVIQAQTQLETSEAQAINNGIVRAQYEHAIAVLIGEPPAFLCMRKNTIQAIAPTVPAAIPSDLLERRPDIAQAERLMAQANANIGVAIAAFYPSLTFTGTASFTQTGFNRWFSYPGISWILGAQAAETFLDGGLRCATVAAARASYEASVASYRQVVFTAFQDVEDNLASVRILKKESVVQNQAAADAEHALRLVLNQYRAGTVPFASVIIAETTANNAEKSAADVQGLRLTSTVGLIKALGGCWSTSQLSGNQCKPIFAN